MVIWALVFGFVVAALRPLDCDGVEEEGVRWDVVRSDLSHALEEVLHNGALGRDLHAAKDSQGRDPAISYGDVQLQRHLERFQKLVLVLPDRSRCPLGRQCLRVLVSVLYSGLMWDAWFKRYEEELWGLVHGTNWTEALAAGWPIFEVIALVAELYGASGGQALPAECRPVAADLWDLEQQVSTPEIRARAEPLLQSPCALARACGFAALAAAPEATWLARSQAAARMATGRAAGPRAIFAQPFPQLLLHVDEALKRQHRWKMRRARLDIIYCGTLDIESDLRKLCDSTEGSCYVHFRQAGTRRAPECFDHYRSASHGVAAASEKGTTLLVSPLTWTWTQELSVDLQRLLRERQRAARDVALAGLPTINRSSIFNWPVRRVLHKYWKLAYEEYATGHETSPFLPLTQFWAVGDSTSGTRVYSSKSLAGLVARLASREAEYVPTLPNLQGARGALEAALRSEDEGAEDWLVMLDLLAKEVGLRSYTYLNGASLEDSYQAAARLTPRLSRSFHLEAAYMLPRGGPQEHCLFPDSKAASSFAQTYGVVVSWCTRMALRQMFRDVGGWWLSLDPLGHIIVPVSASVLNLYRSGETELFPWDADIDANFIAAHPVVLGSFLEEHAQRLQRMGYSYILKGDRVVFRTLADTARMDIWISGPQEVRAYDIRARLCGLRVNLFRDQLMGSVWYYRPGEKIYGNTRGRLLQCQWKGHNACLPDCVRNGLGVGKDGCEFPDRFVHLST